MIHTANLHPVFETIMQAHARVPKPIPTNSLYDRLIEAEWDRITCPDKALRFIEELEAAGHHDYAIQYRLIHEKEMKAGHERAVNVSEQEADYSGLV